MTPDQYCRITLPKVSRTFALNIAVLRGELYKATLCSYLLCRIIDTVEDTSFRVFEAQLQQLNAFKEMFLQGDFSSQSIDNWVRLFFSGSIRHHEDQAHYDLIQNTQLVIRNFETLSHSSQRAITHCIDEMATGMGEMLLRKQQENGKPSFLKSIDDLNRYCYYVAGTVGLLATRFFTEYSRHFGSVSRAPLDESALALATGLQMTNIIKDCWRDYQRNVCYFPEDVLNRNGLSSLNMFDQRNMRHTQRIVNGLVVIAVRHLSSAIDSILTFPRRALRIRLTCLWPLFLALGTLHKIKDNPQLLRGSKVSMTRQEVKNTLRRATMLCLSNRGLKQYFHSYQRLLIPAQSQ